MYGIVVFILSIVLLLVFLVENKSRKEKVMNIVLIFCNDFYGLIKSIIMLSIFILMR